MREVERIPKEASRDLARLEASGLGDYQVIAGELIEECSRQEIAPLSVNGQPDTYMPMFARALKGCLLENEEAQDDVGIAIAVKRLKQPFPASYAFHSSLRIFQMLHSDNPGYPYDRQEDWDAGVYRMLSDPRQVERFRGSLIKWNVGSDVETRAAGPKIAAHTLFRRKPSEAFSMISVGAARDHALVMMANPALFPSIAVQRAKHMSRAEQAESTDKLNQMLQADLPMSDSYGVDLWELKEKNWELFLESCRYYPSEFRDSQKRQRYKKLEKLRDKDPRVHHIAGDFADSVEEDQLEPVDMVVFSTCLYQNHPEIQRDMFDKACRMLKPLGRIVVQDFVKRPERAHSPHPLDEVRLTGPISTPFTYKTLVYDPKEKDSGLQELMSWNNGRCERLRPSRWLLQLAGIR